jgi:hypothetical protein
MHGFEWNDVRGKEGTGFVRAIRTILTSHLPQLLPSLKERIADHIDGELTDHGTSPGMPMSLLCVPTMLTNMIRHLRIADLRYVEETCRQYKQLRLLRP